MTRYGYIFIELCLSNYLPACLDVYDKHEYNVNEIFFIGAHE